MTDPTQARRDQLLARRQALLGPNVPTFYDQPLEIVRGAGAWLWDGAGRRYLDCYNNVPHVGHCHPRVLDAMAAQGAQLNTHSRYLHDGILDYGERLVAKFGHGLSQMLLTCTGSEANDIALRMAQAVTGQRGLIATDNTYHGNTSAVSQLSTRRPPIGGRPDHVRLVPAPDSLAPLGGSLAAQPQAFAAHVAQAIAELQASGHGFAGLMLCPVFANEGLPGLAPGFLDETCARVRAAGGLILCDEVQPGFGRLGTHWWGHDYLGFAPDLVTLGKPMGNGYPVAGLVTRPEIMAAFRAAFGYFNTFAGNPVACAAATAVLDVLEEEGLLAHAAAVGAHGLALLQGLRHPLIQDRRGAGLFFAVEFAENGRPAPRACARVVEAMRERGVLLGRVGRAQHILKLRPPMPITADEIGFAIATLDEVLADLPQEEAAA